MIANNFKTYILISLLIIIIISCRKESESSLQKVSQGIYKETIDTVHKFKENERLIFFLEKPLDLVEFKKKKDHNFVTTSVTNGLNHRFHPNIIDSVYYNYYSVNPTIFAINRITVFKFGKKKHWYEDNNEILIQLDVVNNEPYFGKANLIGKSKSEIEKEFGENYDTLQNKIIYSHKNKVLLLELKDTLVTSYRYVNLNTENIDSQLLQLITNDYKLNFGRTQ